MPSAERRRILALPVLAVTLALAGCASGAGTSGPNGSATASSTVAPVSRGASQVHVTLTSDSSGDRCAIDHARAKAGPVTFTVQNVSSTAITEVELLSDQRILGEQENLAPGLAAQHFTVTLPGGAYSIYCPGAATETLPLTVTGTAAAASDSSTATLLTQGTTEYGRYVTGTVGDLVTAVANLKQAVDSGDVAAAKQKYGLARPFYERIESDVEGFVLPGYKPTDNRGNLDYLIDMRASNLDPSVGWHGLHAIERDLWQSGRITASTKALAAELQTNVGKLQTLAKTLTYKPEDLANGAASLLEEVQTSKIKGEEESFSHLDLVDFAANVEGAQQAFADLEPGLKQIDPTLTATIAARFTAVDSALDAYRDPKAVGGFVAYTPAIRAKDASKLSAIVQSLQAPLSTIAEKVATA